MTDAGLTAPYPLPGSVFLETSDPETARREMSKILAPHAMVPLPGRGPFHARHHHARLAGMSVNFIQYRPGATIRADLSRRYFLIHYVLSGKCRLGGDIGGRILSGGDIAIINPTEPFSLQTSADCAQIVIKLESDVLSAAGQKRFSISADTPIRFDATGAGTKSQSVTGVIDLICREADRHMPAGSGPKTARMLSELLAVVLIESLPHNQTAALARSQDDAGIAPWYVKRVEEYIELHADQPLSIADMTAIAGVSERSLYSGFRTWRGTSPKSYLKAVRLDRVRTELLGSRTQPVNVSDVARDCGFRHMGNFARDYRQRFGERPSDTLRFRLPPPVTSTG